MNGQGFGEGGMFMEFVNQHAQNVNRSGLVVLKDKRVGCCLNT